MPYHIHPLYRHRASAIPFDDTPLQDEWQLEVYLFALGLMKKHGLRSVVDVGCGSAYKLLTYLGAYDTLGLEVSPTYEWLVERYPERRWGRSTLTGGEALEADLVICADVIEHLPDPDVLLRFLGSIPARFIVLSTPARDLITRPWWPRYWGPPRNKSHVREWTQAEFAAYVATHLRVLDHRVTNLRQCTQMLVCTAPHDAPA